MTIEAIDFGDDDDDDDDGWPWAWLDALSRLMSSWEAS